MPTPIDLPASATTDSNGNAAIVSPIRAAYWTLVWATCQGDGTPEWALGVNSNAKLFGAGANAVIGPIMVPPNSQAGVQVLGATAGSSAGVDFWGFQSAQQDGSDLAPLAGAVVTQGSLSGIIGPVTIGEPVDVSGTVGTTDAGLAGSIAQRLSQFTLLTSANLTSDGTTTIQVGAGTSIPYPDSAASWQIYVVGLGGTAYGCRVSWTSYDAQGTQLGYRQRDSSTGGTIDKIIGSGILDAPAMTFAVTLPNGAPEGCVAYLYTTALLIQDNWYDSGIYEEISSMSGFFNPGFDGILATVSNTVAAGGQQVYQMPTYRGPVQIGVEMSQAGHLALGEETYTGSTLSDYTNIPVSESGLGQQFVTAFLAGVSNSLLVFNDDGSSTNDFFVEVRAIKDLLD